MISPNFKGTDPIIQEKVNRLFLVLHRICSADFLRRRLSFYGGTALHSIHFGMGKRLSVDLDFNFREVDNVDWGEVRNDIDDRIKRIFASLGYDDFRIQPRYPMTRFDVKYENAKGIKDSLKVEIGYIRRMPLTNDLEYELRYSTIPKFTCLSPRREELFANKLITLISRGTSRDLFDSYVISESEFDEDQLRKILLLENVSVLSKPMTSMDLGQRIHDILVDRSLLSLISDRSLPPGIKEKTIDFFQEIVESMTDEEQEFLNIFYSEKKFRPELLDLKIINPSIADHPAIKWKLKELA